MKLNKIIAISLLCMAVSASAVVSARQDVSPKKTEESTAVKQKPSKKKSKKVVEEEKKEPEKKATPYEKLFKDKKAKTVKGFMTLHLIEGKVYMELPLSLIGKQMLVGTTAEQVSDAGEVFVGQQPRQPIHIVFTKTDSLVQMRRVRNQVITDQDDLNMQEALKMSNIGAISASFPIRTLSPDSTAIVFDATSFFLKDDRTMQPIDRNAYNSLGGVVRSASYKSGQSLIRDVAAYDDNVSVTSDLTYGVSGQMMGFQIAEKLLTVVAKRSIMLLPEEPMRMRIADSRVGTTPSRFLKYSGTEQGSRVMYSANRWKIEPSDLEAYKRGEKVEPVKPIVFYVDTLFSKEWTDAIHKGIEKWNAAFERIGYKNAIQVLSYPKNDTLFDANSVKYTCVKYAQTPANESRRTTWTDPRSGEILSASIYLFHGMPILAQRERLLQTAMADPMVRSTRIPDDLLMETITADVARQVGFCLGLEENAAGTSSYPVDSLRSASFTAQYGLSASIMDAVPYNFIAQEGDKERGVKLIQDELGPYDYQMIKWLYSYIPDARTAEEEVPTLNGWIREKSSDPAYFYGKQIGSFDPRTQSGDLGDNAVDMAKYGFKSLKYVLDHAHSWIDKEDPEYTYRLLFPDFIFLKAFDYARKVMYDLGGVYLNERYVGDTNPTYEVVPKARQKESLLFMLEEFEDLTWMDNKELLESAGLNANMSEMAEINFNRILLFRIRQMILSTMKSDDPYTRQEALKDASNFIFRKTKTGAIPSRGNRTLQIDFISMLISDSKVRETLLKPAGNAAGFTSYSHWLSDFATQLDGIRRRCGMTGITDGRDDLLMSIAANEKAISGETDGVGPVTGISYYAVPDVSQYCYALLREIRTSLQQGIARTSDKKTKDHYRYLLLTIDQSLK